MIEEIFLRNIPLSLTICRLQQKTFIIPARQNRFDPENNFTKLHFVGLVLQWIQTLQTLDRNLEVHSDIHNVV